ncbi:MAG: hypothetical protein ACTSSQ_06445, partial [Alphaproteobacteria bacterium]
GQASGWISGKRLFLSLVDPLHSAVSILAGEPCSGPVWHEIGAVCGGDHGHCSGQHPAKHQPAGNRQNACARERYGDRDDIEDKIGDGGKCAVIVDNTQKAIAVGDNVFKRKIPVVAADISQNEKQQNDKDRKQPDPQGPCFRRCVGLFGVIHNHVIVPKLACYRRA